VLLDRRGLGDAEQALVEGTDFGRTPSSTRHALSLSPDPLTLPTAVPLGLAAREGQLTLAGAVLLADGARVRLPACLELQVDRYELGRDDARDRGLGPSFSRRFAAPLTTATEAAAGAVAIAAPCPHSVRDVAQQLLMEVLHNAIGHRSYLPVHRDDPVVLAVWTDGFEVRSPGLPPSLVALEDDWFVGHRSRNPRLMGCLGRLGRAGQWGRGQTRIPVLAQHLGWRVRARCEEGQTAVRVDYLPRPGCAEVGPATRQRLPRGEVEVRLARALSGGLELSARELAEKLGTPRPTVRAALARMVRDGRVRRTRKGVSSPGQRYRLDDSLC